MGKLMFKKRNIFLIFLIFLILSSIIFKNIFLLLLFVQKNSYFDRNDIWKNLVYVITIYIAAFFQRPNRYALVLQMLCFDPKYLAIDQYFIVDFDSNGLILFLCFREVSIQKKKAFVKKNFWFSPYKSPDQLTAKLFLHTSVKDMFITL